MKKNNLLHIVDMQNSFCNKKGILFVNNADLLVDKINSYLLNLEDNMFNAILYTQDTHFTEEYPFQEESKEFPIHCVYSSFDWDLSIKLENINKSIPLFKLYKNTFDCFAKSNLHTDKITLNNSVYTNLGTVKNCNNNDSFLNIKEFLKHYPATNTNITIIGVALDYCVKYAINGYLNLNYTVNVINNLTVGIKQQAYEMLKTSEYKNFIDNKKLLLI